MIWYIISVDRLSDPFFKFAILELHMKYKALAAAMMFASANAYALEGKVVDSRGAPIAEPK